ncbi:MAG: SHOCT domain-containing protein [bacterium]|nr:SHOCT domain-containing protein [bacterium]
MKLRPLFFRIGLFSLMAASICFALLITGIAKDANTIVAYILGILFIVACCSLSLNTTSSILDAPKDRVTPFYRKTALILAIATGIIALLWLVVLFAGEVNMALRYIVGKQFQFGNGKEYLDAQAAYSAALNVQDDLTSKLVIIKLAIAFTIVLAYINLIITHKFALKNKMKSIQFVLYLSSFIFFAWFFILTMTYTYDLVPHTDKNYYRLILRSNVDALGSAVSAFVLISSFMVFMIMKISSARSVRRGRNQILYGTNEDVDALETTPKNNKEEIKEPVKALDASNNDVKARIEKLNELHTQGLITDEEYEKKKKDIIDSL